MVSYQDQHLHDHWNTLKVWGEIFPPLFGLMIVGGFCLYFLQTTRLGAIPYDYDKSDYVQNIARTEKDRIVTKRHFLDVGKRPDVV